MQLERSERPGGLVRARVGQQHVVADGPQRLEAAGDRRVHHRQHVQAAAARAAAAPHRASTAPRPGRAADPGSVPGSHPMCAAPWTLFWPRSGLTPAPGLPDVAGEQRQVDERHHAVGALHVLGEARARARSSPALRVAYSRAAAADRRGLDAADLRGARPASTARPTARKSSNPSTRAREKRGRRPGPPDDDVGHRVEQRRRSCRAGWPDECRRPRPARCAADR